MSAALLLAAALGGAAVGDTMGDSMPAAGTTARPRLEVDASFTYGGPGLVFGVTGRGFVGAEAWSTDLVSGSADLGLWLGYQGAPAALQGAGVAEQVSGATHRVHLWASLGHTFHFFSERRLAIGLHAVGGWSRVVIEGHLVNATRGVDGSFRGSDDDLVFGLDGRIAYRFTERFGVVVDAMGFPMLDDWAAAGWFSVGAGVVVALR